MFDTNVTIASTTRFISRILLRTHLVIDRFLSITIYNSSGITIADFMTQGSLLLNSVVLVALTCSPTKLIFYKWAILVMLPQHTRQLTTISYSMVGARTSGHMLLGIITVEWLFNNTWVEGRSWDRFSRTFLSPGLVCNFFFFLFLSSNKIWQSSCHLSKKIKWVVKVELEFY